MPFLPTLSKPIQTLSMAMLLAKRNIVAKAYPRTKFPRYDEFIQKIRRDKERSVYASASELYYAAFFGRDAIEAAEDLLMKDPTFAKDLIPMLASHQGTQFNLITEEEPGRIHHEYRMSPQTYYDTTGEVLPAKTAGIYQHLAKMWGGTDREMTYYGSVDATPLYIKLIARYIEITQDWRILEETYIDKDGQEKKIQESLVAAIDWLVTRIENGPREDALSIIKPEQQEKRLPLLDYKRSSVFGITNQTWKDSITSVIHINGVLANSNYPIATIEIQGHAYDALAKAARIFSTDMPEKASTWHILAKNIQKVIFERFWLPEKKYFAMGLDRDAKGKYRLITTLTSDQTELLNTELFENIPILKRKEYISGIIKHVYNDSFLTDVGIRSRSLIHDNLVDFWDYHGSRTVWIKATYDFVKGLQRQRFYSLSEQLQFRILNGIRIAGSFVELFYVAPDGRVIYNPRNQKKKINQEEIPATTIPEHMQTWTASAVEAIEFDLNHPIIQFSQPQWVKEVEDECIERNPQVNLITSPRKAYKAFPKKYSYSINVQKGHEIEQEFAKKQRQL